MKPHPAQPLPAALDSAVQRLKLAARDAAQRTVESLGLAALAALSAKQREQMLAAQFELNRKLGSFALAFNDAFDEKLVRELGRRVRLQLPEGADADSLWDSLRLVDDGEVEAQISADRFAMDVGHACEWELREIEAYLGSVLPEENNGPLLNPLRPELVGHALVKAIHPLSERAELRQLLVTEIGRSMTGLLRSGYAAVVADWRQSGLRPASLAVRRRQQQDKPADTAAGETGQGPFSDRPSSGQSAYQGLTTQDSADYGGRGGTPSNFGSRASLNSAAQHPGLRTGTQAGSRHPMQARSPGGHAEPGHHRPGAHVLDTPAGLQRRAQQHRASGVGAAVGVGPG